LKIDPGRPNREKKRGRVLRSLDSLHEAKLRSAISFPEASLRLERKEIYPFTNF